MRWKYQRLRRALPLNNARLPQAAEGLPPFHVDMGIGGGIVLGQNAFVFSGVADSDEAGSHPPLGDAQFFQDNIMFLV